MKIIIFILSALSLSAFAEQNNTTEKLLPEEQKQYSVGLGKGAMFSGIGVNFAFVAKHDMKYVSAGCTEYSSQYGASCGFGAGWIKTDLIDFGNNKHGFGIYISKVGQEVDYYSNNDYQYNYRENDVYGLGLSYTYFMNGIDHSGFNFGGSLYATNAEYDSEYGVFMQAGYQF